MATVLDIGILSGFSDIFAWLMVFVIVYGGLEVTNMLKNRGLHALLAFVMTAVIVISGGGANIIVAMTPWVVVIAAVLFFMMLLGGFVGIDQKNLLYVFGGEQSAGRNAIWFILIPLVIILVIAWTQGSPEKTVIDPTTGEEVVVQAEQGQQRGYLGILTDPKVLGLMLILGIGAMTVTLMARGGAVGGAH